MDVDNNPIEVRTHTGKIDRFWLLLLALLAAIPFRDGFIHGEVVGAGPDVISTLWGMWWLQQEGIGAVFGTETIWSIFLMVQQGLYCRPPLQ